MRAALRADGRTTQYINAVRAASHPTVVAACLARPASDPLRDRAVRTCVPPSPKLRFPGAALRRSVVAARIPAVAQGAHTCHV